MRKFYVFLLALIVLGLSVSDSQACGGRFRQRISVRHVERTSGGFGSRIVNVATAPFRLFGARSVGGCGAAGCATSASATATATTGTAPVPMPPPKK